jgi:protein Tex
VHQDGLVHISELCDRFVKTPADVVSVQQKVTVTVLEVDLPRKRIALSMRSQPGKKPQPSAKGDRPGSPRADKRRTQKTKSGPAKSSPQPFNNPFADAFGKVSGR